jgi:hypothetical protein
MAEQENIELYQLLGIDRTRFDVKIKPILDDTIRCRKVDLALLKLEGDRELTQIEKIYGAYCIGSLAERNKHGKGFMRKLGLIE